MGKSVIEIGIDARILPGILNGRKTVEGRLAKGKFLAVRPGDVISVRKDTYVDGVLSQTEADTVRLRVLSVDRYGSFNSMLTALGYEITVPQAEDIESALAVYSNYYSSVDEQKFGVLAIRFELIS